MRVMTENQYQLTYISWDNDMMTELQNSPIILKNLKKYTETIRQIAKNDETTHRRKPRKISIEQLRIWFFNTAFVKGTQITQAIQMNTSVSCFHFQYSS